MSKYAHPNINAVGLMMDIIEAVYKRQRGNAKGHNPSLEVMELAKEIAVSISVQLDREFGTDNAQTN